MRLNNKLAIITGSASGFGKGIAEKFTEEGANLILVDVNSKLLKKVSKNLSQDYFVADVSKASSFNSLLKYAYKNYNSLSAGFEFVTNGHLFQIVLTNSRGLGESQFIPGTYSNWLNGEFRLGFSITRNFKL